MLDGLTLTGLVGLVGLTSTLLGIAAFWLGQKKAASTDGKHMGLMESNLNNLKDAVRTLTQSVDALTLRLAAQEEKREKDYREMLVSITKLESSAKSLHVRVDELTKRVEGANK